MTRHKDSLNADYFEDMFQNTADPWDLESSAYEQAKYDRSIAALNDRIYGLGFEVGCAKGVLTARLAAQCHALLAVDVSDTALEAARLRCAEWEHVSFGRMAFPQQTPAGAAFDLIVLSEVVYYWDDCDIARAGAWIAEHLAPGGDVLLVHWTGDTDYPQSGDEAVSKMRAALGGGIYAVRVERQARYRLDLWRKGL